MSFPHLRRENTLFFLRRENTLFFLRRENTLFKNEKGNECSRRLVGTLTCRNVQRFRGGLAFEAHGLFYHSTLGLRVIKRDRDTRLLAGRPRIGREPDRTFRKLIGITVSLDSNTGPSWWEYMSRLIELVSDDLTLFCPKKCKIPNLISQLV